MEIIIVHLVFLYRHLEIYGKSMKTPKQVINFSKFIAHLIIFIKIIYCFRVSCPFPNEVLEQCPFLLKKGHCALFLFKRDDSPKT